MSAPDRHAANSPAARDIAAVIHPYTNLKLHLEEGPLMIRRGEGIHVWDDDGKQYIEGLAGLWCASLGFDNDRLVEAATQALRTLPFYHQFTHKSHMPGVEWRRSCWIWRRCRWPRSCSRTRAPRPTTRP